MARIEGDLLEDSSFSQNTPMMFTTRNLAEMISVAGVIGFFVSVVSQTLTFESWNINFLEIASPSDVIMSGLQIPTPYQRQVHQ